MNIDPGSFALGAVFGAVIAALVLIGIGMWLDNGDRKRKRQQDMDNAFPAQERTGNKRPPHLHTDVRCPHLGAARHRRGLAGNAVPACGTRDRRDSETTPAADKSRALT